MGGHRLFFALWPNDEFRAAIQESTFAIARASGGRLIPPRNYHVTLLFLGDVPDERVAAVQEASAELAGSGAFELNFDGVETWQLQRIHAPAGSSCTSMCPLHSGVLPSTFGRPARQQRKLLCLTPSMPPAAAIDLAARLRSRLNTYMQRPEEREYRPHITLARDLSRGQRSRRIEPLRHKVADFSLVESVRDASGSQYSVLKSWPLNR